jgi:hypothetical protein
MHFAALYGRKDILEYIPETSYLLANCQDRYRGTALDLATFNKSEDCVNFPLSKGPMRPCKTTVESSLCHGLGSSFYYRNAY